MTAPPRFAGLTGVPATPTTVIAVPVFAGIALAAPDRTGDGVADADVVLAPLTLDTEDVAAEGLAYRQLSGNVGTGEALLLSTHMGAPIFIVGVAVVAGLAIVEHTIATDTGHHEMNLRKHDTTSDDLDVGLANSDHFTRA